MEQETHEQSKAKCERGKKILEEKETMDSGSWSESSYSNDEQSEDSTSNDAADYATPLYGSGDNGGASSGYNSASGDFPPSSSNEYHTEEIVKTNQPAQTKSKKKKKKRSNWPTRLDLMPVDPRQPQRIIPESLESPEHEYRRKGKKTSDSTPESTNVEQQIGSTTVTENELGKSETSNVPESSEYPRLNDNAVILSRNLELDAGHVSEVNAASHNVISDDKCTSTSSNHTVQRSSENQRDASFHATNSQRPSIKTSASESALISKPKVTYDSWVRLFVKSPAIRRDEQQQLQPDDALKATRSDETNQQELDRTVRPSVSNIRQQKNALPQYIRDWKPWDPLKFPIFTEERIDAIQTLKESLNQDQAQDRDFQPPEFWRYSY